jgi:plasmid stabilization system protein ParE
MKRFRVRLTIEAEAQLEKIDEWWAANRREHPELVREEASEAIRTLAAFPEAGVEHRARGRRGLRKMLLPRSQYLLYYAVNDDQGEVVIAAVWHASRGKGPPVR